MLSGWALKLQWRVDLAHEVFMDRELQSKCEKYKISRMKTLSNSAIWKTGENEAGMFNLSFKELKSVNS